MTINQVIEKVSRLSPGAVEDRDIADWILELDQKMFLELHMPETVDRPLKWPEDSEKPLVVPPPMSCSPSSKWTSTGRIMSSSTTPPRPITTR